MDCLSAKSPIQTVILEFGAQLGKTETGNNWIGTIIDLTPAPTMAVQPTVDLAKRYSKQRVEGLIDESPRLREKVKPARERDSGNTQLSKDFTGGILVMTGANSAVGLRSMPVKYLFLDEIDAYPGDVDGEGDPISLAEARTRTFARKKILKTSTPTIANRSRIDAAYLGSDMRRYFVPCPHCGEKQVLVWEQIKWEEDKPDTAVYACIHNGCVIEEYHKTKMLAEGEWRAENPAADPKTAGFHLNSLYSPLGWYSWGDAVRDWVTAKGSQDKLRAFVNTVLAETWKEKGEAPDWRRLYERREKFKVGVVPKDCVLLTAGCDVQKDRLEVQLVAWGAKKNAWSVDYLVFPGDTTDMGPNGPWVQIDQLLQQQFEVVDGDPVPISRLGIDSGYNTQQVYDFVRRYPINRVVATKGSDHLQMVMGSPSAVDVVSSGKKIRRGLKVWPIGVSMMKSELYGLLRLDNPTEDELKLHGYPPGFIHFPEYGEEFFKQITAEEIVVRIVKGFRKYEWEKKYERNEALDTFLIARAMAAMSGLDRMTEKNWVKFHQSASQPVAAENNAPNKPPDGDNGGVVRRKSSFWK